MEYRRTRSMGCTNSQATTLPVTHLCNETSRWSMTYSLTFEQKPSHLHAIVTGVNSRENVLGYLEAIRQECIARNSSRLLIEERLEGPRLDTLDVFEIVVDRSRRGVGPLRAIAYVDVNARGNLM